MQVGGGGPWGPSEGLAVRRQPAGQRRRRAVAPASVAVDVVAEGAVPPRRARAPVSDGEEVEHPRSRGVTVAPAGVGAPRRDDGRGRPRRRPRPARRAPVGHGDPGRGRGRPADAADPVGAGPAGEVPNAPRDEGGEAASPVHDLVVAVGDAPPDRADAVARGPGAVGPVGRRAHGPPRVGGGPLTLPGPPPGASPLSPGGVPGPPSHP